MYQTKRIEINESNVQSFYERFGPNASPQPVTNQLLEKYFKGKLVEIDDNNFEMIMELSKKQKSTTGKIINFILEAYEWAIETTPKQRITLDINKKKIKPIKKVKQQANVITQF